MGLVLFGSVLLAIGFGGAGVEDARTNKVSDYWIGFMLAGAYLFYYPFAPGVSFLVAVAMGVLSLVAWRSGGLGIGDIAPLTLSGFVLGWYEPLAIATMVLGLWASRRLGKVKTGFEGGRKLVGGAAVAWLAFGVFFALTMMLLHARL